VALFNQMARCGHRSVGAVSLLGVASWFAFAASAAAVEEAVVDATAAADQAVEFNVYLPLHDRAKAEELLTQLHTPGAALYHQWLTPAQFNEQFGPQEKTVSAISRELAVHGLQVTEVHAHSLHVSGTVGGVKSAFGATLAVAHFSSGRQVMAAASPLRLTPVLAASGAVVSTFSSKIHMQAMSAPNEIVNPQNRYSNTGPYWFDDLKQAYSYPSYTSLNGKGVTIGILMFHNYNPPDMKNYFSHELLAVPKIQVVNVAGGAPFDPNLSFETHIDIQQSGGMAPKATIILYNVPDLSDESLFAGLTQIIESNVADVVNMSFGGFEAGYSAAYNNGVDFTGFLGIYDDFFMEGNALGITFVASSGDQGGKPAPPPACFSANPPTPCGAMQIGISSPASSPHVTAVGGTNLVTTFNAKNPTLNSAYVRENAFPDPLDSDIFYGTSATGVIWGSGGGISIYFPKPSYQTLVSQKFLPTAAKKWRTNPDVALQMGGCPVGTLYFDLHGVCPPDRSAVVVALDGQFFGAVGTSISSPDFAGLLALKIQSEGGRLGNENYDIYALAAAQANGSANEVFRQNITGNNGVYSTAPGYNLVLGNGTVVGNDFVRGSTLPVAGIPQTSTNP
jgi:subtilase family serine protease